MKLRYFHLFHKCSVCGGESSQNLLLAGPFQFCFCSDFNEIHSKAVEIVAMFESPKGHAVSTGFATRWSFLW